MFDSRQLFDSLLDVALDLAAEKGRVDRRLATSAASRFLQ